MHPNRDHYGDFDEEREISLRVIEACQRALELFEHEPPKEADLKAQSSELRTYQEEIGVGIRELEGKLQQRIGELYHE